MQTYSHFLLTWALERPLKKWLSRDKAPLLPPVNKRALLTGSVAPDLLLIGISVVCGLLDLKAGRLGAEDSLLRSLFSNWFFHDTRVIAAQNLLHGPLVLAMLWLLAFTLWTRTHRRGGWLFWFSGAAMLHTLIDIPLHHDDGPLLLFPFEWHLRFASPVSYWDPNHFGREVFLLEHALVIYLIILLLIRRLRATRSAEETHRH